MSRWLDLALDALAQARAGGSSARPVDSVDSADRREDRPASRLSTLTALSTEPALADFEERAAIIEFDGGIPRQWAEGLARVDSSRPPPGVAPMAWRAMIDRAARFCDQLGATAAGVCAASMLRNHTSPRSSFDDHHSESFPTVANGAFGGAQLRGQLGQIKFGVGEIDDTLSR